MKYTTNDTDLERAWEKHSAAISVMNQSNKNYDWYLSELAEQSWESHSHGISLINESNERYSWYLAGLADAAVDALPFGVGPDLEEEEENEFEK